MNKTSALLFSQIKRVGRDKIFIVLTVYPLVLAIIGKYIIPVIQQGTLTSTFNLVDHYHTLLVLFVVMNPFLYGDILGLMLIDEREDNTLYAIRVLPIKMQHYIIAKCFMFFIASIISGMVITWLVDLYYIPFGASFLINFTASLGVFFTMILINLFASNKVEGFAVLKISNVLLLISIIGLYVKEPINYIFGIIPAFWPSMAIASFYQNFHNDVPFYLYCFIGIIYTIAVTIFLYEKLYKKIIFK